HFALHFHAAVYAVLAFVRTLQEQGGAETDDLVEDYPFLGRYLAEDLRFMPEDLTWDEGGAWWGRELRRWEGEAEGPLPLRALSTSFGLSPPQRRAFMLTGLIEEDSRFGTLFAHLQAPVQRRRPTVELLGRIVQRLDAGADGWGTCRPLVEHHLVEVIDRSRPRAEWTLRIPGLVWDAARGTVPSTLDSAEQRTQVRPVDELPTFDDAILPADSRKQLCRVPRLLRSDDTRFAVVRGTTGSDRLAALDAVARTLERGVVRVEGLGETDAPDASAAVPGGLGPFCVGARMMPVLEVDLAPGESRPLPPIPGYDGPVGVALSPTGGLTGDALDTAVTLSLGTLSADERRRHWRAAFEGAEVDDLDAIVDGFQLPGRYLRRAGAAAVRHAALDGRETVTPGDVRHATRSLGRQLLDTLAERLEVDGTWDRLVIDPRTEEKLHDLKRRCHHRERLLDHLGPAFGSSTTKGVRALFTGPSGTGKTLAARILAAELGMDLYRVDLASVINKYVGETEKNLHRLLSTAEELDVVLLLDEGDALLGTRTEVSTANDRYANVETDYLLQRLEHYAGILLVTSNLAGNIDPAFQRRMDRVIDFAPPSAEERLAIWSIHLPEDHTVSEATLRRVARVCALNGGQIRNAAQQATLLALDEATGCDASGEGDADNRMRRAPDEVAVRDEHVVAAVREEYQKDGAVCPLTIEENEGPSSGAQQFVQGVVS
ncbi:MAG: ATP-binding protein, partial [Salinibacter sp.]|uniref:ATP-binding protein n=1 Tax=Salinibacter sp. TaxID=2065818 RepID=UPI002FC2B8DB